MSRHRKQTAEDEFKRLAGDRRPSVIVEFWQFLLHNKKWWLLPIIVLLGLLGALVLLSGTPLAPWLYPLF